MGGEGDWRAGLIELVAMELREPQRAVTTADGAAPMLGGMLAIGVATVGALRLRLRAENDPALHHRFGGAHAARFLLEAFFNPLRVRHSPRAT